MFIKKIHINFAHGNDFIIKFSNMLVRRVPGMVHANSGSTISITPS